MKKLALICAAAQFFCLAGHAQLVLNPGDSWCYQFSSIVQTGSVSAFVESPNGSFTVALESASFQPGDKLRYEMFESSLSDEPLCSGLLSSAPPFTVACQANGSWQDLAGVIRLTAVSGSLSVTGITLRVVKAGASLSSYEVHATNFVPVAWPAGSIPLSAAAHNGRTVLTWPQANADNFHLQGATDLLAPIVWRNVTNTVYPIGGTYYVTNDTAGANQFFRLQKDCGP